MPSGGSWGIISGATSSSYTTPTLVAGDNASQFRCVVTNSCGSVNSNGATLTVNSGPTVSNVTSDKSNGSYTVDEVIDIQVTFSESVTVTGTPLLELDTGATNRQASYVSGSPGTELTFRYYGSVRGRFRRSGLRKHGSADFKRWNDQRHRRRLRRRPHASDSRRKWLFGSKQEPGHRHQRPQCACRRAGRWDPARVRSR
jgi:hypothetical protein